MSLEKECEQRVDRPSLPSAKVTMRSASVADLVVKHEFSDLRLKTLEVTAVFRLSIRTLGEILVRFRSRCLRDSMPKKTCHTVFLVNCVAKSVFRRRIGLSR